MTRVSAFFYESNYFVLRCLLGLLMMTSSVVVAELSLYMNETETRRLLGVPGELYYVRNGYVNDYALSFNQLVKTDVTDIYFDWFDETTPEIAAHKPPMEYSLSVTVSNMHAMYQPHLSIPFVGIVPNQRSGFSVSVLCTGLLSIDVELRLQVNITTSPPYKPLSLNIRRKKSCLRGIQQAPRPINRQQPDAAAAAVTPVHFLPSSVTTTSSLTPVTTPPTAALPLSGLDLDETAGSIVFYASVGGALASVVIMATVVIICYLATSRNAKNLDSSQSSSPLHTKMISGDYESGIIMSNKMKSSNSLKNKDAKNCIQLSKQREAKRADTYDVICDDDDTIAILESLRIEPCRLKITETLLEGKFSALYRAKLISGTSTNQLIEDDVMLKTFIPEDSRSGSVGKTRQRIESMMRECRQLIDLCDENLCPVVAVSCFSDVRVGGYPSWLVYGFATTELCLQTYFELRRQDAEVSIDTKTLLEMIEQLTSAVKYLHGRNIIHKDIAARNCTLDTRCMVVRITDGALSSDLFPQHYYPLNDADDLIPVRWTALEILESLGKGETQWDVYSTASDMWSLGVTVWELMTSCLLPYAHVGELSVHSYLMQGHRLPQPYSCSSQLGSQVFTYASTFPTLTSFIRRSQSRAIALYSIISQCWCEDANDRPPVNQLYACVQHLLTSYRL